MQKNASQIAKSANKINKNMNKIIKRFKTVMHISICMYKAQHFAQRINMFELMHVCATETFRNLGKRVAVFNRPGVAGAVLQTASSLIN